MFDVQIETHCCNHLLIHSLKMTPYQILSLNIAATIKILFNFCQVSLFSLR